MSNVDWTSLPRRRGEALFSGGGDGTYGGMDAHVARLESDVGHIKTDIADVKSDIRELRRDQRTDFRITWGAIIGMALGLAGLMATGFGWL